MNIAFRKREGAYSQLICTRDDGSRSESLFPNKRAIPHELIHYVVEKTLGLHRAFYGLVANGAAIAYHKEHNHPLTKKHQDITQNWQSELLVEAIQTTALEHGGSIENFYKVLERLCVDRNIPVPKMNAPQLQAICVELQQYHHKWNSIDCNHQLDVSF
ncbi:MAG: hypothetical protein OEX12_01930 [Gammaproteobacteria bacterium]|nr:hypothetical protein [Gammaproteobacteria bacterium]